MSVCSLAYEGIDGKWNSRYSRVFIIRVAERFNAHVAWPVSELLIHGEYAGSNRFDVYRQ